MVAAAGCAADFSECIDRVALFMWKRGVSAPLLAPLAADDAVHRPMAPAWPCRMLEQGLEALETPFRHRYTLAARRGACIGLVFISTHRVSRVQNSVDSGRRLALRAVGCQLVVVLLLALVFLVQGWAAAAAVLSGGLGVAMGNALAARVALGGGVVVARSAFLRLVLATLLKWGVAITAFAVALVVWRSVPLPMFAGFAAAVVAYPLGLNFLRQGKS